MTAPLDPNVSDKLYAWLCECAAAGDACPTNQAICDRYGFKSIASAAGVIKKLEVQGRIEVTRFNRARQVRIVATGQATAAPNKPPRLNKKPSPRRKPLTEKNRTATGAAPMTAPGRRTGPKGRQCQWIEGEPTETDDCKCLAMTVSSLDPYCPGHTLRSTAGVYIPNRLRI